VLSSHCVLLNQINFMFQRKQFHPNGYCKDCHLIFVVSYVKILILSSFLVSEL
jgi:hypothetical protein